MGELHKELAAQLEREEGRVKHVYQDHLGYWTIGVGRLVDKRKGGKLRDSEIDFMLANDISEFQAAVLKKLPWAANLSPARLGVLIAMSFQMGVEGLLEFKNTLKTIQAGDYKTSAEMLLQSKWAGQTPARAKRMAKQMETGVWQ